MKKVIFLLFLLFPLKISALSASSSIVMDLDNGRILHQYNIHDERLIASITKIMTAIVTIEYADIDKTVTVGEEILEAYGSAIYIELGEKLTLRDLLYGLMLRSGNDAAVMIATYVAGSEEAFVKLMNDKAKKIGMKNTTFVNSSGLDNTDSGNYSTAYDMALLTRYAMQYDEYREIVKTKEYMVKTDDIKPIPKENLEYLNKIIELSKENNIKLIFVGLPSQKSWNYAKHNAINKLSKELQFEYINLNMIEEIDIDWQKDTRDKGDHLNYFGAKKVSKYLGEYLKKLNIISSKKNDSNYNDWNMLYEKYKNLD